MSLKEIEKLRDKVDRDPNSKLFVPLADEYRKEGMLDEAIEVLIKGLEKQPAYTSARVALGKIYVEKMMLAEAQQEFETVVKTVPDNLFAQKKLAEIYRDTGQRDLALKSFKAVLRLNPMDEDTIRSLKEVETPPQAEPARKAEEPLTLVPEEAEVSEAAEAVREEEIPLGLEPQPDQPHAATEEDLNAFKEMVFGDKAEDDGSEPVLGADEHPLAAADAAAEAAPEDTFTIDEELSLDDDLAGAEEAPGEIELAADEEGALDLELPAEEVSLAAEETVEPASVEEPVRPAEPEDTAEAFGVPEGLDEAFSVDLPEADEEQSFTAEPIPEVEPVTADTAPAEPSSAVPGIDEDFSFDDVASMAEEVPPAGPVVAEPVGMTVTDEEAAFAGTAASELPASVSMLSEEADSLIAQNNYLGAIERYQRIIAIAPEHPGTRQRIEELKALLKMMGKDKEVLITKLNAFLDAVHKRKDEFYGRTQGNG